MKIRKKVTLTLILICIIPIIVLGSYCYHQTKTILVNQNKEDLQNSIEQISSNIDYKMQIYNNLLNYLAFNNNILEALNKDYTSYFDIYNTYKYIFDSTFVMLKYFHKDILKVTIFTESNLPSHGDTIRPLSDIKDTLFINKALEDYNIQWFTNAENKIFSTKRLFWDSDNLNKNLLYMEIDFNTLFSSLQIPNQTDYDIYIIDETGKEVYSKNDFKLNNIIEEIYNKKEFVVVKQHIESCGWTIYIYKPVELIIKSANQISMTVLSVITICLCILLPLSKLLSYILVNKIEKLTVNMENIEIGKMDVVVTSDSKDEVGELIRNFGSMINRINNLIKEVYESKLIQKEFEMKALQAQINPHFLYNVLSLINWKAITSGDDDISHMTQLLSTFYRTSLNKGKNLISVEDELKNTMSYIEIQLIMHTNSFDVIYDIDENVKKYFMINLLLQPLAENAVCHGIDHKINGRGCLHISGKIVGDDLIFIIEDNGAGINDEIIPNLLETQSKGYGLKNVNDRIKLFYGSDYGLIIESVVNEKTIIKMKLKIQ